MSQPHVPRWLRPYIDEIRARGYDVKRTKGGHYAVIDQQGKRVCTLPGSPHKGSHSLENNLALLRRLGILSRKGKGEGR